MLIKAEDPDEPRYQDFPVHQSRLKKLYARGREWSNATLRARYRRVLGRQDAPEMPRRGGTNGEPFLARAARQRAAGFVIPAPGHAVPRLRACGRRPFPS